MFASHSSEIFYKTGRDRASEMWNGNQLPVDTAVRGSLALVWVRVSWQQGLQYGQQGFLKLQRTKATKENWASEPPIEAKSVEGVGETNEPSSL